MKSSTCLPLRGPDQRDSWGSGRAQETLPLDHMGDGATAELGAPAHPGTWRAGLLLDFVTGSERSEEGRA